MRDVVRRLVKAPAALSILWPALLILGGYVTWHRWGAAHVGQDLYRVDPTQITVTPQPEYIRTNLVKTVYRDTAMDGLSLMDREATAKIASAFLMHPWVRNVTSVRKLPGGGVDVRLEYRRPVAMVQVFRTRDGARQKYFFPVDGSGVLLPPDDFAQVEQLAFVHIDVPGADSSNAEGMPFGDVRVEAAAGLAEFLGPLYAEAKIKSISVSGDPRQMSVPQLELTTEDQSRLFWGSPPGQELPGERTAAMKLEALFAVAAGQNADLRMARPASRSLR